MPRYSLDDPNLKRHHIALLLALVRQAGGEILIEYGELERLTGNEELELVNDNRQGVIRLTAHRAMPAAMALPSPDIPALEGKDESGTGGLAGAG
jgi:hypothetical protein